jgi:hypothetical protein
LPSPVDDPKHWYDRGAEMRALADLMRHEETKTTMHKLADDYDKLGDRAAERRGYGINLSDHDKLSDHDMPK